MWHTSIAVAAHEISRGVSSSPRTFQALAMVGGGTASTRGRTVVDLHLLLVELRAHPRHECLRRERLLQECHMCTEDAPLQHLVVGITGNEEHVNAGTQLLDLLGELAPA